MGAWFALIKARKKQIKMMTGDEITEDESREKKQAALEIDGPGKSLRLVISDLHLGTGVRPGKPNTHEEFYADQKFREFLEYYSTGEYEDTDVELIIAGDFLDLLKIAYKGKFVEDVTEPVALDKVRRCLRGHPVVFDALRAFIHLPKKRAAYIPGNHDQDVFFPRVQQLILSRLDALQKPGIFRFITDDFYYRLPGGVVVTHGHQFEAMNYFDINKPIVDTKDGRITNYPFGSRLVVSIISPFKREEPLIGVVTPMPLFLLYGLFFRISVTVRLMGAVIKFFILYWLLPSQEDPGGIMKALQIMYEQAALFSNLEKQATRVLRHADDISVLIAGHSHAFKIRRFVRKKLYINTGTWTKFVNLDISDLGTRTYLTYARVEYMPGRQPDVRLMRWRGKTHMFEEIPN